jgi:hypothetical protein
MPQPVKLSGEILNVAVKSKKIKERGEGGMMFETVVKIGRITIEFDGDAVDVTALAQLVHGRPITLELDEAQHRFGGIG